MKGEKTAAPSADGSSLVALLRRRDRERYQTALFAPVERRAALFALYAFNSEVARVRESVTQPMLGQIRLQWWREAVAAAYAGETVRRHEVATPFAAAIHEFGLSRAPIDRLIDARERDLDDTPPPTLAALEAHAEATSSGLVRLALEILGVRAAAAEAAGREVGVAYALAGLLRAMSFHARGGRCYIPAEIAVAAGIDPRDYAELRVSPSLRQAAAEIAHSAAGHLAAARRLRAAVPRAALPALLPALVADRALARLRRAGDSPFDPRLAQPDPLLPWRLAAAVLRGRF